MTKPGTTHAKKTTRAKTTPTPKKPPATPPPTADVVGGLHFEVLNELAHGRRPQLTNDFEREAMRACDRAGLVVRTDDGLVLTVAGARAWNKAMDAKEKA